MNKGANRLDLKNNLDDNKLFMYKHPLIYTILINVFPVCQWLRSQAPFEKLKKSHIQERKKFLKRIFNMCSIKIRQDQSDNVVARGVEQMMKY